MAPTAPSTIPERRKAVQATYRSNAKRSAFFFLLLMAYSLAAQGQQEATSHRQQLKGRLMMQWGYNRAGFSRSHIHFSGVDYDFTLRDVAANDRPEPLTLLGYLAPGNIWIPQYAYRAGYFISDRWSISIGLDHMKYVVVPGQVVRMQGHVDGTRSTTYAVDDGSREVILSDDLLTFEHTDGLNYLGADVDHYDPLWSSANGRHALHLFEGVGAGPVIPRTDVRLFGEGINNNFHVSGYALSVQAGLHFTFFRCMYLRTTFKSGWMDLPDVLTTGSGSDRASQHFWFWQGQLLLGGTINLMGRSK